MKIDHNEGLLKLQKSAGLGASEAARCSYPASETAHGLYRQRTVSYNFTEFKAEEIT